MSPQPYRPRLYYDTPAPGGPIGVNGKVFTRNGQPFTVIESSEFSLPKRYLCGEDIVPILVERAALGFNTLRCWWLNKSVVGAVYPDGIHPAQHEHFYKDMRAFTQLCASYGFICEHTAFTSTRDLMPKVDDQKWHWQQMQIALAGLPNVLLELVNEYDWGTGENAPDRSLWSMRPSGILSSSGSATADAAPPEPVWDYVLYHTNGLSEFQRKVGHNAMEYADHFKVPAVSNENTSTRTTTAILSTRSTRRPAGRCSVRGAATTRRAGNTRGRSMRPKRHAPRRGSMVRGRCRWRSSTAPTSGMTR